MAEKPPWALTIGKRVGGTSDVDTDSLLRQKQIDRERARIERQEEIDAAEHEARIAKLNKEKVIAESTVEKAGEKKEEAAPSGFKVTGGVDIGTFNLQQEREDAKAESERLRAEVAKSAEHTAQENATLRQQLHTAEMREMKAISEASIAAISDKIDRRSPVEIISDIKAMAAELGLKAPDPGVSDPSLQLQIIQMQHAEAQRQREFEWQMQKDRDAREDKKDERSDLRAMKAAELNVERERTELFAKAPEVIGMAIGHALRDSGNGDGGGGAPAKKGSKGQAITAAPGQSGEISCGQCGGPLAVGPTAKMAVCPNRECGAQYPIRRTASVQQQEETEEE